MSDCPEYIPRASVCTGQATRTRNQILVIFSFGIWTFSGIIASIFPRVLGIYLFLNGKKTGIFKWMSAMDYDLNHKVFRNYLAADKTHRSGWLLKCIWLDFMARFFWTVFDECVNFELFAPLRMTSRKLCSTVENKQVRILSVCGQTNPANIVRKNPRWSGYDSDFPVWAISKHNSKPFAPRVFFNFRGNFD